MEHVVRMGELAVSRAAGDVLACVGLGSCIGLLVVDRTWGVAALAHVMLPQSPPSGPGATPAKFADTAIPVTVEQLVAAGARPTRLEAALVGGASMFAMAGGQEIGARNEQAVRQALAAVRVPVVAAMTGGDRGRTVRAVLAGSGELPAVTVREAGGTDVPMDLGRSFAIAA
ncbi:chemotaxis protein CheD [Conexibacter sp. SYSU D00693]|uniref:chemotaxis protein CheD n=1 Tax=Conexibacter sp. SYSU D00693 TaxID=2812560 RepID=UPI00196B4EDD|nr:chemotaxis protein CheD [Conexibacter sp. SYSU D00693]